MIFFANCRFVIDLSLGLVCKEDSKLAIACACFHVSINSTISANVFSKWIKVRKAFV